MLSESDARAALDFLHLEARLADEGRYAEWLALWTDDAVYWVPATTDPAADPDKHLSHIYDNRARLETRVKMLETGVRWSQAPASLMRRLIGNVEVRDDERGELAVQARHEMHWWVGRAMHRLRRVDGALRLVAKKVVLINDAEPLPNLGFLL